MSFDSQNFEQYAQRQRQNASQLSITITKYCGDLMREEIYLDYGCDVSSPGSLGPVTLNFQVVLCVMTRACGRGLRRAKEQGVRIGIQIWT